MARIKEVFSSHSEVAHVWAQQNRGKGRTSDGNVYFEGTTIFSYGSHFPIASFQSNASGHRCVLFTTEKYSISTSKHILHARRALGYEEVSDRPVFHVPLVHGRYSSFATDAHQFNLDSYSSRIKEQLEKAASARKYKAMHYENAIALRAEMERYAKFFEVSEVVLPVIPVSLDDIKAALQVAKVAEAKRKAEHDADMREQYKDDRIAWINGSGHGTGWINYYPTELRIVGDEVQTSQGARFPVTHAKRGLALVEAVIASGEEWKRNGKTCHLGYYQIDRIEANGTVHAGCHVVPFGAIARIREAIVSFVATVESEVA